MKILNQAVLDNLFPAARPAVEPWETFRWHYDRQNRCDTDKPHSSQALAIDVFGTLGGSPARAAILNALAAGWGLPAAPDGEVQLEWLDPHNRLKERRQSQIDAVASSREWVIFFECKFTEPDGGSCSQPPEQCNGNYAVQVNPHRPKLASRCALSGKGIRYWEVIPQVFRLEQKAEYTPCPFAGAWFQWMRNLALCYEVARASGRQAAFVVVYADAPGLAMAEKVRSEEWQHFTALLRPQAVRFGWMSYQELVRVGMEAGGGETWEALGKWVEGKIERVARGG